MFVLTAVLTGALLVAAPTGAAAGATGDTSATTAMPIRILRSDAPGHVPLDGETTVSLDGTWAFRIDPGRGGVAAGWTRPETDVSGWDRLPVPGNWDVHDRYATYRGAAFYRRDFAAPPRGEDQVARLRFDAVYESARVWLNGQLVGSHAGGYTPFEFDVTKLLRPGGNTLVLEANNTESQGAWWPWGGPSRSVSLVVNQPVRVREQRVVATPDLDRGDAVVRTQVTVENAGADPRTVSLSGAVTTVDGAGQLATTDSPSVRVPAGEAVAVTLTAQLRPGSFELWQLDHPSLYRFRAQVADGPRVLHDVSDRFGIRQIELRGTGFYLNGEQARLNGYNRVQDDRIRGNTEPAALVRRDLDRMKAAGANMMRLMCVPQAPQLLDYADQIGMLVIAEVPVWGGARDISPAGYPSIQREMREMVARDFNHPSIFAYSVGNEIAADTPVGREYDRVMTDFVRGELDPTRLVTQVSNSYPRVQRGEDDGSRYMDFVSINMYGDFERLADHAHQLYPDKPIFISEFSPDSFSFPVTRESVDFRTGAAALVPRFATRPWLVGSSMWTFNDYRSGFGGTSANEVRGWGIQTVWGEPKLAYGQMQAADAPVDGLAITPSQQGGSGISLLEVDPRGASDQALPAFILRGYRLAWQVTGADGAVLDGGIVSLPDIAPGDARLRIPVRWDGAAGAVEQRVSLLSPTGYEVAVASAAVRPPGTPQVTDVVAADGAIRAVVAAVPGADGYQAIVSSGGNVVARSAVTREDFADVTGLTGGVEYQVSVIAVNGSGASEPSRPRIVTPMVGQGASPPQIQAVVPVEAGFVVGYSDSDAAARTDIRVLAGDEVLRSYVTDRNGSSMVEGLEPGATYGVQVRRVPGSGNPSAWSERRQVTTESPGTRPTMSVQGAVAGTSSLGVRITPDPDAVRYEITAIGRDGGQPVHRVVEASAVDLLTVDGLSPDRSYQVQVRVQSSRGWSQVVGVTARTEPEQPSVELTAPTGLSHEAAEGAVTLRWSNVDGAVGYLVSRLRCDVPATVAVVYGATYVDLATPAETAGSYQVAALASGQVGPASAPYEVPKDPTPREVLVDDSDVGMGCDDAPSAYRETGTWLPSTLPGWDGGSSRYSNSAGSNATWTPDLAGPAAYRVEVWFPTNSTTTTSATYTVRHAEGEATVVVNQRAAGGAWVTLGTWTFAAGTEGWVRLTVNNTAYHRADAVRFSPVR